MFSGNRDEQNDAAKFPGIDKFRQKLVYRSMGMNICNVGELLGAGFMHKDGLRCDSLDLRIGNGVMVIILRGKGVYVDQNGAEFPLSSGMYFMRYPGISHSVYLDHTSQWAEYFLAFGEKFFTALSAMGILRKDSPVGKCAITNEYLDQCWKFMMDLEKAPDSALPELAARMISLLNTAQDHNYSESSSPAMGRLIEQACDMLASTFVKKKDIAVFCRNNGCGYENFRKQFRKQLGCSPWQYHIRRRLDNAAAMLKENDDPISIVAAKLGYSSAYEFSAQFKRKYGMPPSKYRNNINK